MQTETKTQGLTVAEAKARIDVLMNQWGPTNWGSSFRELSGREARELRELRAFVAGRKAVRS